MFAIIAIFIAIIKLFLLQHDEYGILGVGIEMQQSDDTISCQKSEVRVSGENTRRVELFIESAVTIR